MFPLGILKEGCPEGFLCITDETAAKTGLYIRDAIRFHNDVRACPLVEIDETLATALERWIQEQQQR